MFTVNAGVHVCLCGGGEGGSGEDLSESALERSGTASHVKWISQMDCELLAKWLTESGL